MTGGRARIAVIASARFPIRQPFAGGLEAHTWALADGLRRRGHEVSLFAAPGSDPQLMAAELPVASHEFSDAARADVSMPERGWMFEHHAYLELMLSLMNDRGSRFDIVHNNSLHHLPVAMASAVRMPIVTTLHTPPTPWLESAIAVAPSPVHFVAVSSQTARAWQHVLPRLGVIRNGVDLSTWRAGAGGGVPVWFGRLVPEKGPDLAIRAARLAGLPLRIVGPRPEPDYFDRTVAPLLGDGIEYLGHLSHAELAGLVGSASATLVTPRWDEPYGLVAAESLACGTPVAGFARGALPELLDESTAVLVRPDDVTALADALIRAQGLSRAACRRRAERHCSVSRMVDEYERLYLRVAPDRAA